RAVRGRQASRVAGPQDPAIPVAALQRRSALYWARGKVRQGRRHSSRLQGNPRGQARRPSGAGLLHGGHHRGGAGAGRTDDEENQLKYPLRVVSVERSLFEGEVEFIIANGA